MGLEGRKVKDNVVMFGEPLNEKTLKALQNRSPTADSILSSLPPSAFIPIQESKVVEEENKVEEVVEEKIDKVKLRREKKKLKSKKKLIDKKEAQKKEAVEQIEEDIILNSLINDLPKEEVSMDLEKELEALSQKAEPKIKEEPREEIREELPATDLRDQILDLLKGEPNPPNEEMIAAWKDHYGKSGIHVMAFGEGEVYIYHHLTRGEWKKLKELMARLQESSNSDEIEEQLKEKVVGHCILWPAVDAVWLDRCKAGVIDSLYQMILLNSGFLSPQQAMLLTTQL